MSDPDAPPLDAAAILRAFRDAGAEFVVVGGIASLAHGATRLTRDIDICPDWSDENLTRVTLALRRLGAQMKTDQARGMGTQPSIRMLRKMEITTWRTPHGDVDVVLGIPRDRRFQLAQFRQLNETAVTLVLGEDHITVASLQDIITSKEIANRPADNAALPELRAILARQRAQDPPRDGSALGPPPHRTEPDRGLER